MKMYQALWMTFSKGASRKNSPVAMHLAKPIPLAQSEENSASALDDIFKCPWQLINMARALAQFAKPIPFTQSSENAAIAANDSVISAF